MRRAIGRTEKDQLVEIVLNPTFAKYGACHHATAGVADGQSIGRSRSENIVCRLTPTAPGHKLVNYSRVARNVFLEKRHKRLYPQIARAAGVTAVNNSYGLALIKLG